MTDETPSGTDRVKDALGRLAAARRAVDRAAPQRLEPCCPFDTFLEERIKKLEEEVKEARGRNNGLLMLLVGAVVTQIILRLVGV